MRTIYRPIWLLAICCGNMAANIAQQACAETVDDTGLWTALFAAGDLNPHAEDGRWRWWYDGHMRFLEDFDGFGQSLVRPGVGYKLTDKLTVWAGYCWIHTNPEPSADFDEHRIWEQLTWSHKFDVTSLDLRSRFEQRLVETGDDTGMRFRQMVALRRPMGFAPNFTWVGWDELFFHLNDTDWGARDGFDQNRAFLGVGWKPSPEHTWRLEVGYLNQFIDRNAPSDVCNHLLSLNLFWNP